MEIEFLVQPINTMENYKYRKRLAIKYDKVGQQKQHMVVENFRSLPWRIKSFAHFNHCFLNCINPEIIENQQNTSN